MIALAATDQFVFRYGAPPHADIGSGVPLPVYFK